MKTTFFILFAVLLISNQTVFAQYGGSISYNYEKGIEAYIQQHINLQKSKTTTPGFRVQIAQDNNRETIQTEKNKLNTKISGVELYETYDSPFFKLRAGDFKDRFSAYKLFMQIKPVCKMAFIVSDNVNNATLK